jgi:diguanylate cyclase (GGDEF)-like protein/PAS domain S-box-containing protein
VGTALAAAPVAAALVDSAGVVHHPNAALAALVGVPIERLAGQPLDRVLHPDEHRRFDVMRRRAGGTPSGGPARVVRADGTVRWVRIRVVRIAAGVVTYLEDTQEAHSSAQVERAVEERFELLARHVSDALLIVDANGRIRRASVGVRSMLGYEPEDVVGADVFAFVHPDDHPAAIEAFQDSLDLVGDRPRLLSLRVRKADGEWCEVEASSTNHIEDGAVGGLVVTMHDVSAIRRAREHERAADQRFRMLVDALPDPVVIFDRELRFSYANATACELVGTDLERLKGTEVSRSTLPRAIAQHWQRAITEVLATGETRDLELSFPGSGSPRWFWTRLAAERGPGGAVVKVVAVGRDITERKEAERRLEDLARRDPLTGLANRRHLDDVLSNALDRARASGQSIAVMFLDLDGLKEVNDTHGHDVGDGLLIAFARRLRRGARVHDTTCRLGGDEFVVVCEALTGVPEAVAATRRTLDSVSRPYGVSGLTLGITASIGLVVLAAADAEGVRPADLLRDADAAMYHAKVHGGGTMALFDRTVDAPVLPSRS